MPRKTTDKLKLAPIPEKPEHSEHSEHYTPERKKLTKTKSTKKASPKYSFRKSYAKVFLDV